jgi:hypothetical protein
VQCQIAVELRRQLATASRSDMPRYLPPGGSCGKPIASIG